MRRIGPKADGGNSRLALVNRSHVVFIREVQGEDLDPPGFGTDCRGAGTGIFRPRGVGSDRLTDTCIEVGAMNLNGHPRIIINVIAISGNRRPQLKNNLFKVEALIELVRC